MVSKECVLLLVVLVTEISSERCQFDIRMKQTLLNEGFHRNLTYGIVFKAKKKDDEAADGWWFSNCMVGLEQQLSAGVFVNPDELKDLRRLRKVNAFPSSIVNIELMAEEASPTIVYIIGRIRDERAALWVPLHARYHRPKHELTGIAINTIPKPELYLQCPDDRLALCDLPQPSKPPYLCNGSASNKCGWKKIPYTHMSQVIRWEVPIGDVVQSTWIMFGTCMVVFVGSLYLLRATHRFNRTINKKIV